MFYIIFYTLTCSSSQIILHTPEFNSSRLYIFGLRCCLWLHCQKQQCVTHTHSRCHTMQCLWIWLIIVTNIMIHWKHSLIIYVFPVHIRGTTSVEAGYNECSASCKTYGCTAMGNIASSSMLVSHQASGSMNTKAITCLLEYECRLRRRVLERHIWASL